MQKLQDSVFSITKTINLSPAVFSFLQPTEDFTDKTPLGGILSDTRHGWLALGPKFCVVDLKTGLKVAAKTFGTALSNCTAVTSVVELPTPLTDNSKQLIISLECEAGGVICVLHVNGSQILRCIQTDVVVTELAVCNGVPDGPFTCFDGVVMAGTKKGDIFAFDLNRSGLIQALKDISQGYENLIRNEINPAIFTFLPLNAVPNIEEQRDMALENDDHIAVLLNENSMVDGQYIFRNPDGTVRMKAKRDHIRVSTLQYIPQLGSLAVGYNFGAFQIWNLLTLDLEFTSQVNVECLPVTHFGFQEPCDDPRAFCYLWVVFSVIDRFEEEEFPLAVMYSLTYQGKRMVSDTKCLYQEFLSATIRFQIELSTTEDNSCLVGGKCISCHTYSVNSTLGEEGEDSMLNICQLIWECWGENANSSAQYGMLLFDLDQWYKDQMPATYRLESNAFMSATSCRELSRGPCRTLDLRLDASSVAPYSHATRLEEHFYPNSLQYNCICLNTSESCVLSTNGIQRQIISSMDEVGPTALLNPTRLYQACLTAGLTPLYQDAYTRNPTQEEQRKFLLSVALEARLSRFLKRCAHDWATGSHTGAGCTLTFLVDWCWKRAIELKENAKELTAPLFASSAMPDRNVLRCLEHCVQQLTQLTSLLDAVLTKCCNLVVPDALSEIEEKYKGIGTVSLYFQVVQWFARAALLPERGPRTLRYPREHLATAYANRRLKLHRLQDNALPDDNAANKSCSLLYIDQLIEQEFGGERIHKMWLKGGSESNGLYPPPSLYSLLRLYLLPDIAEEHKHSLVLYLLVDYSMVYDEVQYEAVIRRLMQFPTMFGLSNTAIKATQAFWHLDHRDFDFALDQLQCLTGNTLSEWQHNVVLSSLLAQKKTQAALQYLHVRKPAPIQNIMKDKDGETMNCSNNRVNDHDKLEDWQSCCNLYLARELVFEALDVIRMCVQNASSVDDKRQVLNFFFKGCRNTGQLSKLLQVTLLPFEEEVFIKYLEKCNEPQTSDILIMYYLQQARYLEAQQYNNKLKHSKSRAKDISTSVESLAEGLERENARDILVEVMCTSLPPIAKSVAHCALNEDFETHIFAPKPMSVFVQAKSSQNKFTYKSSFIQDTIENASETWVNKPKMRKGIKRALNIEDTPFICTPKLTRTRSVFSPESTSKDVTPAKRAKFDLTATPKTPKITNTIKVSEKLCRQMETLLYMPEEQGSSTKLYERTGAETPQSILKIRRNEDLGREAPSPVDSRYLGESDEELLETASNHTYYSDSTNKHLRFIIPTASESGSTPSPVSALGQPMHENDTAKEILLSESPTKEMFDASSNRYVATPTYNMQESHRLESPSKKLVAEEKVGTRKLYKDNVKARRSLSISANSSLSDDPNTSIESIADIPVTLINPRYSGEKHHTLRTNKDESVIEMKDTKGNSLKGDSVIEIDDSMSEVKVNISPPRTPKGRRGIRAVNGESTPLLSRSRSMTPDRQDATMTPLSAKMTRSRSRTPEVSPRSSPLAPIPEQPKQEIESEPHALRTTLSAPRQLRSRSRTPERIDKSVIESPRLEAITESPTKSSNTESEPSSPSRRSLRSRSRTPEMEIVEEQTIQSSPRNLRSRSKTPEKLMSPKTDRMTRSKKSLSRIVLEANTFAKNKTFAEKTESELNTSEQSILKDTSDSIIECTPLKPFKPEVPTLMDVTFSPIVNKSVLQSSIESTFSVTDDKGMKTGDNSTSALELKPLPAFTMNETYFEKSVLCSYQSSVAESTRSVEEINVSVTKEIKTISTKEPLEETTVSSKSVLKDVSSLMTSDSDIEIKDDKDEWKAKVESQDTAIVIQKEKERIVEIEREINEIEGNMSEDSEAEDESVSSGDEEIIEADEDEEDSSESENSDTSTSEDEEIISIKDSDTDDSTSGSEKKLQIDEQEADKHEQEQSKETTEFFEVCIQETQNDKKDENTVHVQDTEKDKKDEITVHAQDTEKDKKDESTVPVQATDKDNKDDSTVPKSDTRHQTSLVEGNLTDTLDQDNLSLLTDDNSVLINEHSDINLNYSDENKTLLGETNLVVEKEVIVETDVPQDIQIEVIDEEIPLTSDVMKEDVAPVEKENPVSKEKDVDNNVNAPKTSETVKPDIKKSEEKMDLVVEQNMEESEKPASRSRKRTKSTSSTKPKKESQESDSDKTEEPKTPMTKKRLKSNASNKSSTETEQKSPENIKDVEISTPSSRRRAKTPSSTEVRKILTRRASKELAEKMDDSIELLLDESALPTPRRRSTRSRSKNVDDNASVASESSVKSVRSRASEDAGDVKPAQVWKGRKSILSTKPDLSVIPEITVEEAGSKGDQSDDIINEYSSARRLTRHQKAVLESWLEPKPSPKPRRTSTASRASIVSEHSHEDDDASSTNSGAFEVQPMDRISLLNKTDFEGPPDDEEMQRVSPESAASDASKQRRSRLSRAASETKSVPKKAKTARRISVDVVETGQRTSPPALVAAASSPSRVAGRRASFTRACQALHTPKGRRASTDVKKSETESQQGSPTASESEAAATPTRRTRRASTQSNTSQTRSKKSSAVEESKDTKKK